MIKSLPYFAFIAIGFGLCFLLMSTCERQPCPECPEIEIVNAEVFPEEPTVTIKEPEVKKPIKETPVNQISHGTGSHGNTNHGVSSSMVSQAKYDSLAMAYNTLSNYRRYADSIQFENLIVFYRGETLGYLTDIDIGIIDDRPTLVETRTITKPPKITYMRGIYGGLGIGGNKSALSNIAPSILYVDPKLAIGYDFNVIDKSHNVTVRRVILWW